MEGFTKFTPAWLLSLLADGALGTLYFLPSAIALVSYAWLCFWLIDKLISVIGGAVTKPSLRWVLRSPAPIGSFRLRLTLYASRVPGLLLKMWVGLPMFAVLQLTLSKDPAAIRELSSMASGYAWEAQPLERLPVNPFWNPGSLTQFILQILIIGGFALYTYRYWSRGFDFVGRIRIVGDALMELLGQQGEAQLSLEKAREQLGSLGWSLEEVQSASWFLGLLNARIVLKNNAYEKLTPRDYGLLRMTRAVILGTALAALHPVVAGLYLASQTKKLNKVSSNYRKYKKHVARLPAQFRARLSLIDDASKSVD